MEFAGPGNIFVHASDAVNSAESRILASPTKSNGHVEP